MPDLSIVPVTTGRQQKQFVNLPWKLYADDPTWIPQLRRTTFEMAGFRNHPFYDYSQSRAFLAMRDGQPIARLVAIINNNHNEKYEERRGFFGFFESVDDQEAANGLFDAARAWFAENDIQKIRGPINPSQNYEVGLLIDGFDDPPWFMMTYNPPYYERLIEEYGFRKTQDAYAFWGNMEMFHKLDRKLFDLVDEVRKRTNITVRRVDKKRFKEDVRTFLRVYNESLISTWGYVPLSEREVEHGARELGRLIAPELTSIAEDEGRAIGSCFGMLDYNPRIKKINGRLFPFGFLRLLFNKRGIKRFRAISTNVVPAYQKWGVSLLLLNRLIDDSMKWGIEECEFSWVLESNHLSRKSLQRGGAKCTKTYRIYDYAAAEDAE